MFTGHDNTNIILSLYANSKADIKGRTVSTHYRCEHNIGARDHFRVFGLFYYILFYYYYYFFLGGGGGHNIFLPESLILARKLNTCEQCILSHMGGGGGGGSWGGGELLGIGNHGGDLNFCILGY